MRSVAILAAAAVLAGGMLPAHAGWQAKRKGDVCFATLTPTASRNAPPGRGHVYLAIMDNKAENTWDSLTFLSGYPDVTKSEPYAQIDGKTFKLLPYKRAAYTRAGQSETDLLKAMTEGNKLQIVWKSADGSTTIVDDYDTTGIDAARATIDLACGRNDQQIATQQAKAVSVQDGNGPQTVAKARNPFD